MKFVFNPDAILVVDGAQNTNCVQCQGHSEGLYNQNTTISVVSFELLVGLQPNLL